MDVGGLFFGLLFSSGCGRMLRMAKPRVEGTVPHTQHTPPEGEGWPRLKQGRKGKQKFFGLDPDDNGAIPVSLAARWDVERVSLSP
jgi:hypothetical protein